MKQGSLWIVGTGMRAAGQVTAEARSAIRHADKLFYLVQDVVTAAWLEEQNPTAESLFGLYGEGKDRRQTYEEMVVTILDVVRTGQEVCVAFYGHPGVFVDPGHEAIRRARGEGFEAGMLPGVSTEDCLIADLGFDPGRCGGQNFEASDFLLRHRIFDPTSHLVLWQIGGIGVKDYSSEPLWNPRGLVVLTRVLAESYPVDHVVVVYEAAPYPPFPPKVLRQPLAELPHAAVTVRSTLWVPPLPPRAVDPERRAEILRDR
ncbi:MAG: hypothetical protein K8J08_21995 [Thermoanaerobaculia bacterium]|nr:hypothetical protein [Thermoanaerobaculia bacterium]